jgi:Oxidoreductase molybdopterin binding domain
MDDAYVSRGFKSKRQTQVARDRVPPGQYVTADFPNLSAGPTPQIKVSEWKLALQLGGSLLGVWTWEAFEALPQTTIKTDIHCVTKWSKLDTTWQGVTFDDLLKAVGLSEPPEPYVMVHCDGGYSTNLPLADLIDGKGNGCDPLRRLANRARPWWPRSPAGAASLFLEERKMAAQDSPHAKGRARLLGVTGVPQLR